MRSLRTGGAQAHLVGCWQSQDPEEGGEAGGRDLPRSPSRLPPSGCPWMLLFLALWALVPCLVLETLYFLSTIGGKSGGNKKNDGVKVSSPGACQGLLCQSFWQEGPALQLGVRPRPCRQCSGLMPSLLQPGHPQAQRPGLWCPPSCQDWRGQAGQGED